MKIVLTCLLSIGLFSFVSIQSTERRSYNQAVIYCMSIQHEFDSIAREYGLDGNEVMPIVFPECLRFSEFSDQMETTALEYFYVNMGSDAANFSIGNFQMKPEFIELLEQEIEVLNLHESFMKKYAYENESEKKARAERIWRMTDVQWQINYLCLFYLTMERRTASIEWESDIDKISFFAAAYNYGFSSRIHDIKNWEKQSKFPFGEYGETTPYSELAVNFYLENKQL